MDYQSLEVPSREKFLSLREICRAGTKTELSVSAATSGVRKRDAA